ncbi:MAG: hypothetical protein SFX73_37210 [Kofleriaceae bacterium]|nr:hypothetical protein [Kofleriaceae bacterium]
MCVTGTSGACSDAAEPGDTCCVENAINCVSGTPGSCTSANQHWTGALCCT